MNIKQNCSYAKLINNREYYMKSSRHFCGCVGKLCQAHFPKKENLRIKEGKWVEIHNKIQLDQNNENVFFFLGKTLPFHREKNGKNNFYFYSFPSLTFAVDPPWLATVVHNNFPFLFLRGKNYGPRRNNLEIVGR